LIGKDEMKDSVLDEARRLLNRNGLDSALTYIDATDLKVIEKVRHKFEIAYVAGDFEKASMYSRAYYGDGGNDIEMRFLTAKVSIFIGDIDSALEHCSVVEASEKEAGVEYFWDSVLMMKAYAFLRNKDYSSALDSLGQLRAVEEAIMYGLGPGPAVTAPELRELIESEMRASMK
jgi:hypothetical protein